MHAAVSHGGNGPDRFDHMASDVYEGQVDDGPVGGKLITLSMYT